MLYLIDVTPAALHCIYVVEIQIDETDIETGTSLLYPPYFNLTIPSLLVGKILDWKKC